MDPLEGSSGIAWDHEVSIDGLSNLIKVLGNSFFPMKYHLGRRMGYIETLLITRQCSPSCLTKSEADTPVHDALNLKERAKSLPNPMRPIPCT